MLTTSEPGLAVIRAFEGRSLRAYKDEVGVWTIGYGETNYDASVLGFEIKAGVTITAAQAEQLLRSSLSRRYEPAVNTNMGPAVNQPAFDAGASFHFNTGGIARASWVKSFVRGDLPAVSTQIMQWNKAGGEVLAGLTRRRARERDMILKGDYGPEGKQTVITDEKGRPLVAPSGEPTPAPALSGASSDKPLEAQGSLLTGANILALYKARNYDYAVGEDVYNLCYFEGIEVSGKLNKNRPNAFDDVRCIWQALADGTARIVGVWEATTEPGRFWTDNRMNPKGAFHIDLGQQRCWRMGSYHDMTALVEVLPIHGTRDDEETMTRHPDHPDSGQFAVHHHGGYNFPKDDLGKSSAGCQVVRLVPQHLKSMEILKKDRRYIEDHDFLFTSTVMSGSWLAIPHVVEMQPGMLKRGDKSAEVKELQKKLGLPQTGEFNKATDTALRSYQSLHPQLDITGVFDPGTRAAFQRAKDAAASSKATTAKGSGATAATGAADAATGGHLPWEIYGGIGIVTAAVLGYLTWTYRDEIVAMLKALKQRAFGG